VKTHTDRVARLLKTSGALLKIEGPAADLAKTGNLHELLAKKAGVDTFDMDSALRELGRSIYLKNASWSIVREGISALKRGE
jgi:hypothetical protein